VQEMKGSEASWGGQLDSSAGYCCDSRKGGLRERRGKFRKIMLTSLERH
jgi:hypothetical protein